MSALLRYADNHAGPWDENPTGDGLDRPTEEDVDLVINAPIVFSALKELVEFLNSIGMEYGEVKKQVWYSSYEPMKNAREAIEKAGKKTK